MTVNDMTHEKTNLLAKHLQNRLGNKKPHTVHSIVVFCQVLQFRIRVSVLSPSTDVGPLIPTPNIGFSTSGLSRDDRIWRKGTTNFSCSHLAVDISQHWGRDWARYCTEQPQVSMGGSFPRYRAIKKGCCIGKKPESTSKSVAWTYISCNLQNTNYVFRRIAIRIIYRRERRAGTGT